MPFESKAQRAWMYANKPEMAKKWEKHTPKNKKLPKRAKGTKRAKMNKIAEDVLLKVAADEDIGIGPHHFRDRLGLLGPASGAVGGGLRPLTDTLHDRISAQIKADNPTFKGLFKDLPWKKSLRKMPGGIIPGAISGLVVGHFLDRYLQSKLRRKEDGLLQQMAPMALANNVVDAVEPVADSVTSRLKAYLKD